jgi:hypothetical protein
MQRRTDHDRRVANSSFENDGLLPIETKTVGCQLPYGSEAPISGMAFSEKIT